MKDLLQESRAVARKPRDAAAVLFALKFADNIHYKFKSSQASKARLQSSKHSGAKHFRGYYDLDSLGSHGVIGHVTVGLSKYVSLQVVH